ncbi:hypothetical protein [uncultured Aliiroseovarius sp.]|uniref:hypothetical protein n=1 Tax=uncultured Aliiroseovarius sp. TaxID=1658783 RepID=UPI002628F7D6|nr:hypothetical protein [uncultured Aliiroseovarius sp.]
MLALQIQPALADRANALTNFVIIDQADLGDCEDAARQTFARMGFSVRRYGSGNLVGIFHRTEDGRIFVQMRCEAVPSWDFTIGIASVALSDSGIEKDWELANSIITEMIEIFLPIIRTN